MVASEWSDTNAAEAFLGSREFQIFKGVRILMRDEPVIVLDEVAHARHPPDARFVGSAS